MVGSNANTNVNLVNGGCWATMGTHVAAGGGLCAAMQTQMWLLVAGEQEQQCRHQGDVANIEWHSEREREREREMRE